MKSVLVLIGVCVILSTSMCYSQKKSTTVIGEVVDVVSYMTSGTKANTPEGKEILNSSVKGGNPLGILEAKTGKLYLVTMKQANTGANQALLPYVGMRVAASGEVFKRGSCQLLVMTVIGKSIK